MYIHVHTGEDFGEPISRGDMRCMRTGGQNCLSNWATYERAVKKIKVTKYSNIYCDVLSYYF